MKRPTSNSFRVDPLSEIVRPTSGAGFWCLEGGGSLLAKAPSTCARYMSKPPMISTANGRSRGATSAARLCPDTRMKRSPGTPSSLGAGSWLRSRDRRLGDQTFTHFSMGNASCSGVGFCRSRSTRTALMRKRPTPMMHVSSSTEARAPRPYCVTYTVTRLIMSLTSFRCANTWTFHGHVPFIQLYIEKCNH